MTIVMLKSCDLSHEIPKKVLVLENKTQMPKKQKHRSCEYVGQEIDKQISPKIEISEEKDYW